MNGLVFVLCLVVLGALIYCSLRARREYRFWTHWIVDNDLEIKGVYRKLDDGFIPWDWPERPGQ